MSISERAIELTLNKIDDDEINKKFETIKELQTFLLGYFYCKIHMED